MIRHLAAGRRGARQGNAAVQNTRYPLSATVPATISEEKPMPYQNIDASLSPADAKAVKDAFDTVLKKLPFLLNLTPQEGAQSHLQGRI